MIMNKILFECIFKSKVLDIFQSMCKHCVAVNYRPDETIANKNKHNSEIAEIQQSVMAMDEESTIEMDNRQLVGEMIEQAKITINQSNYLSDYTYCLSSGHMKSLWSLRSCLRFNCVS